MPPNLPATAPRAHALSRRKGLALVSAALLVASLSSGLQLPTAGAGADPPPPSSGAPETPPAQICANSELLDGPVTQPPGSVRVDPGQNVYDLTVAHPPGTTFWLTAGTHVLDDSEFAQVAVKDDNSYIGAPGAILDGRRLNRYTFTTLASGVTVSHLTIQNFVSPNGESVVNHDGGASWTIEYNTIRDNHGAGIDLGSDTVIRYNCIENNGQYGFNTSRPSGTVNVFMDHNEIGHNAADDIETSDPACGCSGGGKFWGVHGAVVTNNWVHHNLAQGLFADTNAVGFRIEGNYINDNASEGIVYETSYNAYIHNNTLVRNTLRKGRVFGDRNDGFPVAAIYISESGGDSRVYGGVYSTLEVTGNRLVDNWGGVVLWENADRFCNTAGNTADGFCPIAGVGTVETCVAGTIEDAPYYDDCRWKTQNVLVADNDFQIDKVAIDCVANCGTQGLFSNTGASPPWSPYHGDVIKQAITFDQNNHFENNRYVGPWQYDPYAVGNFVSFAAWQGTWLQDVGSTFVDNSTPVSGAYPTTPPAPVCGDAALLDGPAAPPPGSVPVDPGTSLSAITDSNPPGTTFWLAPGIHTVGPVASDHVVAKDGSSYVGAPGAVLDGNRVNTHAFGGDAVDVTVRHLTVQRFGAVGTQLNQGAVNHEHATGWTVENNTIRDNAGAGVVVGSGNVVRHNCLVDNGQYGFNVFEAVGVVLDRNEIARNNTDDWEAAMPGCGCSGAGKFWKSSGVEATGNWVHHNRGPGLWADTNNVGFLIAHNFVNDNDGVGIQYELSYNARIVSNTLKRNALVEGAAFAARGDNFPVGAIFIAESGGEPRLNDGIYGTLRIIGNFMEDNWGGVVLWEDANRFCGSSPDGPCTLVGAASPATCVEGTIDSAPYFNDCRWKTKNIAVADNDFRLNKSAIGCNGTPCGQQGLLGSFGTSPTWSPYLGTTVQTAVTFGQGNHFAGNRYVGDWSYTPFEPGRILDFASWRASPYLQDGGSTFDPGPPGQVTNHLDGNTSGFEGSAGQWAPWFSATMTRTTAQAHGGARSLHVDIGDQFWGLNLQNHPGFPATPGAKAVSFWARAGEGVAPGSGVDLTVRWRDASGADLQVDQAAVPALTDGWQQAIAHVVAPAGTARVTLELTSGTGTAGSSLFVDDFVVGDEPPSTNDIPDDTATLEGSLGTWVPWFSAAVSRSTEEAHGGSHSLQVDITAAHGWGVTQSNFPGFGATPGHKAISFWGKAGAGTGLSATMSVHWRDSSGASVSTDVVTLPLGPAWAQAMAVVTAPPGTAFFSVDFSHSAGVAGDVLHLDDISVAASLAAPPPPPPPPAGALDEDTATLEAGVGAWVPWFATEVSRSSAKAHGGSHSLEVRVTSAFGWGVTQSNHPGFATTAGDKRISFWGRQGAGGALSATMRVHWRDEAGATLATDEVTLGLGATWAPASAVVSAPPGTARVAVDFVHSSGLAGDVAYLDDVLVEASAEPPPPPPPPAAGLLDPDTATLENGVGQWSPWFSAAVSSSAEQAHGGSRSLRVEVTAAHGWGVTLANYPGFMAGPGPRTIGFSAMSGTGSGLAVTMTVTWRSDDGTVLGSDVIDSPLGPSWSEVSVPATAPAGTTRVGVDLTNAAGVAGDVIYVDDVTVT